MIFDEAEEEDVLFDGFIPLVFWACISSDAGGMLFRARALRHVVASISKIAPEVIKGAEACSTSCSCSCKEAWIVNGASSGRGFATLPPDYARMRLDYPKRRAPVSGTAVQEAADGGGTTTPANEATPLQGGARAATAWMFPWERRQMGGEGTPLRTWERLYWGVFVMAIATYLFSRLQAAPAEAKVDEDKEAKKVAAARDTLEGRRQHFAEGEDDPFEGMSPQQIQQVMDSQRTALDAQRESERQAQREASASDDPFDGLTPEEINEYVAKHGMPKHYQ